MPFLGRGAIPPYGFHRVATHAPALFERYPQGKLRLRIALLRGAPP